MSTAAKLKARVRVLEVQYDAMTERRYQKFMEIQSAKAALVSFNLASVKQ